MLKKLHFYVIVNSHGPKSDKRDAYALAEQLRVGSFDKTVFKAPRQLTRLRELSRTTLGAALEALVAHSSRASPC